MAFRRDGDIITLTIDTNTWEQVMWVLGVAVGCALRDHDSEMAFAVLRMTNKLNEGNDKFRPYEFPPET